MKYSIKVCMYFSPTKKCLCLVATPTAKGCGKEPIQNRDKKGMRMRDHKDIALAGLRQLVMEVRDK